MLGGEASIRAESPDDGPMVGELLVRAFEGEAEARLVELLRGRTKPEISLVAAAESGQILGHILFTPVRILSPSSTSTAMGLGPMAVLPEWQRRGVGSALVEAGLSACRAVGELVVVVLGHPSYYPRLGFEPAWPHGLYFQRPGPNPAFMVVELEPRALAGRSGEVRYHDLFYGG